MSAPSWLDVLLRDGSAQSHVDLVSQALRLRWQVLEHARLGDKWQARHDFKALKGVAALLRGRSDLTLNEVRQVDLCIREAELALLTCRMRL